MVAFAMSPLSRLTTSRHALSHRLLPAHALFVGSMAAGMMACMPAGWAQDTSAPGAKDPWAFVQPSEPATTDETPEGQPAERKDAAAIRDAELPDPSTVDWSVLNADTVASPAGAKGTASRAARKTDAGSSVWSRNDKPEGVAALSVKQSLMPFWDTRVGADINVAGQTSSLAPLPEKFATDGRLSQSSGSAWAALTAPGFASVWDKTAIEARLDPSQDQSKIGTSISKSLPVGGDAYSLTLQSGYNLIEQSLVPIVGLNNRAMRTYELDRSAKFNIGDTGTSFLAGQSLSTSTDRWLNSMGAEQKLLGGVSITGTVSETPVGNLNKSLTAGFKSTW